MASSPIVPWMRTLHTQNNHRRIAVTGMGLVSCLGTGLEHVWHHILKGHSGITRLEQKEYEKIPCKVAGCVPRGPDEGQLDLGNFISKSEERQMSLGTCYALVAAEEALQQSGWQADTEEKKIRTGVAVGMGMVGLDDIAATGRAMTEKGYSKVSPHFIPRILINMAAGHISLRYGFKGVNHAVSTACTTGVHAIGDAARFIKHGDVDVMVCGGTEASVNPLAIAGFARMRALSTKFNHDPTLASRPFDVDRDGFVMSEGAGILVLEEYEHARKRGANILGEVLGYGLSADANHITAPSENGEGAYRCMRAALLDADLQSDDIGYINAHATSTPLGDAAESHAISRLFTNNETLTVSSTKGALGHLLGAAGTVEAIITVMACQTGMLPPTLNCHNPDKEFNLDYVPLKAKPWTGKRLNGHIALTNSFGFGGTNASLCLASFNK